MKNFAHSDADRLDFVKEMLSAAAGNTKAAHAQLLAITTLADWYRNGEEGEEPDINEDGRMTWAMECAISTDLKHIFRAERPAGTYGSEYDREFIKLRQSAKRMAERRRAIRKAQTGMDKLRASLTI